MRTFPPGFDEPDLPEPTRKIEAAPSVLHLMGDLFEIVDLRTVRCRLCGWLNEPSPNQNYLTAQHGLTHCNAGEAKDVLAGHNSTRNHFVITPK